MPAAWVALLGLIATPLIAPGTASAQTAGEECLPAGGTPAPFETDPEQVGPDAALVLNGGGWGHGVGMSQYGAMGAATLGCDYATILTTYYPGTQLTELSGERDHVAVHLMKRGHEITTVRTTAAQFNGRDLDWVACDLSGTDCRVVATQPAGTEWKVRPREDGTFVLFTGGDGLQCPVTDTSTGQGTTDTGGTQTDTTSDGSTQTDTTSDGSTQTDTTTDSTSQTDTTTDQSQTVPPECRWRGGDLETRLRMMHDGTVIRIVEASGRRVKWGFTEFDYSTINGGTTFVTEYVTGSEDGSLGALDRYLRGLAEMPSSWHPEALRTQAVAGRSYAEATIRTRESVFGRHPVGGYIDRTECRCDLFATTMDQVYTGWDREEAETGAWREAVDATAHEVLEYDGEVVAAFYSSSHGGSSEDVEHVWGTKIPYLPAVDTSRWEAAATRSEDRPWGNTRDRWTRSFTADELAARFGLAEFLSFEIEQRGPGGRPTRLDGGGVVVTGRDAADALITRRYSGETLRSKLSLLSSLVYVDGDPPVYEEQAAGQHEATIEDACPPDQVPEDGFDDVSDTSVHEPAIDCLVWWGVANGRRDGTYDPGSDVRRDQMAAFLSRVIDAAGIELPAEPSDHFTDDTNSTHHLAINQLAELGLVNGLGGGKFGPSRSVTRAQMATFLVALYEYVAERELTAEADHFVDDDGNVHEASINQVVEALIATGVTEERYEPGRNVNRAQMGSFLARVLNGLVVEGKAAPPDGTAGDGTTDDSGTQTDTQTDGTSTQDGGTQTTTQDDGG